MACSNAVCICLQCATVTRDSRSCSFWAAPSPKLRVPTASGTCFNSFCICAGLLLQEPPRRRWHEAVVLVAACCNQAGYLWCAPSVCVFGCPGMGTTTHVCVVVAGCLRGVDVISLRVVLCIGCWCSSSPSECILRWRILLGAIVAGRMRRDRGWWALFDGYASDHTCVLPRL